MRRRSRSSVSAPYAVEPPTGADLFRVRMGDRDFAVVSFPIPAASPALAPLSAAEADVLELILAGGSNREIAGARCTSERTVANQVASLFRKLGVSSRSELAAHASWFAPELARARGQR
jgi:DNA-binding CsgD family transcriptional regulator